MNTSRVERLSHASPLNRVRPKAICSIVSVISHTPLLCCFCSYILPQYFHGYISCGLATGMPPALTGPSCIKLASHSHPSSVHFTNSRVNQYQKSFIPSLVNSAICCLALFFHFQEVNIVTSYSRLPFCSFYIKLTIFLFCDEFYISRSTSTWKQ